MVELTHQLKNSTLASLIGINTIKFEMSCDRSTQEEIKDHYKVKDEPLYIFKYNGPKACPIELPDYITFFSKNIAFLAILFLTSLVGMAMGKDKERLVMALTSV